MPYARVDLGAAACEADSAQTKRNVKESILHRYVKQKSQKLVKYKYLHQKEDEMYIIIMYYKIII